MFCVNEGEVCKSPGDRYLSCANNDGSDHYHSHVPQSRWKLAARWVQNGALLSKLQRRIATEMKHCILLDRVSTLHVISLMPPTHRCNYATKHKEILSTTMCPVSACNSCGNGSTFARPAAVSVKSTAVYSQTLKASEKPGKPH